MLGQLTILGHMTCAWKVVGHSLNSYSILLIAIDTVPNQQIRISRSHLLIGYSARSSTNTFRTLLYVEKSSVGVDWSEFVSIHFESCDLRHSQHMLINTLIDLFILW